MPRSLWRQLAFGHLAVQFAKRMGSRVLAVASGDDGVAFVRGLGADGSCPMDTRKTCLLAAALFAPGGNLDTGAPRGENS